MRPASDVRTALLQAALAAHASGQRPTLLELAHQAQVGVAAATHTVKNMRRAGQLQICGMRRVDYRNRPVAEYAPVGKPADPVNSLQLTLRQWVRAA